MEFPPKQSGASQYILQYLDTAHSPSIFDRCTQPNIWSKRDSSPLQKWGDVLWSLRKNLENMLWMLVGDVKHLKSPSVLNLFVEKIGETVDEEEITFSIFTNFFKRIALGLVNLACPDYIAMFISCRYTSEVLVTINTACRPRTFEGA